MRIVSVVYLLSWRLCVWVCLSVCLYVCVFFFPNRRQYGIECSQNSIKIERKLLNSIVDRFQTNFFLFPWKIMWIKMIRFDGTRWTFAEILVERLLKAQIQLSLCAYLFKIGKKMIWFCAAPLQIRWHWCLYQYIETNDQHVNKIWEQNRKLRQI